MDKKPRNYLLHTVIASAAMFYALRLSSAGRTAIDWAVIALIAAAILWNLVQLARRFLATDASR